MTLGPQFEQLKMFMSAREIMTSAAPLPADFHEHTNKWDQTESKPQFWRRKLRESKMSPYDYDVERGGMGAPPAFNPEERSDNPVQGTDESSGAFEDRYNQWWDSRADSHSDKIDMHFNGPSMHDSIREEGVKAPVSIGHDARGRKTIIGGHHRIAAAADIDPDRLMPVLHFRGTSPAVARQDDVYKYT